jgi:hypothetical protein
MSYPEKALKYLMRPKPVIAIAAPGCSEYTRKAIDELTDFV